MKTLRIVVALSLLLSASIASANWFNQSKEDPFTNVSAHYALTKSLDRSYTKGATIAYRCIEGERLANGNPTASEYLIVGMNQSMRRPHRIDLRIDRRDPIAFDMQTIEYVTSVSGLQTGIIDTLSIDLRRMSQDTSNALIEGMIEGNRMFARVTSLGGTKDIEVSLKGFTKSFMKLAENCGQTP